MKPPPETLVIPTGIDLYPHQRGAIRAWDEAGGRGILEMATGSGKTVTALSLASGLYTGSEDPLLVLVIAPYIHLVDQWIGNAKSFGLEPIRCAEGKAKWYEDLATAIRSLNIGSRRLLSVATTSDTLKSPTFQYLLSQVRRPILAIGDEAHNYGAVALSKALPRAAKYRVGLSATPDRWMDDEGTSRVRDYFGDVAFRYGLDDALNDGVLVQYRYFPEFVELEGQELERYLELTRRLSKYIRADSETGLAEAAKPILLERARLIASVSGKIPQLLRNLKSGGVHQHTLVYCGDGEVEGPEDAGLVRQVDEVVRQLGVGHGVTCAPYTARTSATRRRELLRDFARGDVQVLVAIRCLDEGVDVPETRHAHILASSTNPRQYIQRRGRVLRRAPGKDGANITDYFAVPPIEDIAPGTDEYRVMRRMLGSEIRRASQFAALALNSVATRAKFLPYTNHFRLHGSWEV